MKTIFPSFLAVVALCVAGCSTPSHSKSSAAAAKVENPPPAAATANSLEGAWQGTEITPNHEGPASIVFSGNTLDFHGSDADDWAKGTISIEDGASPKRFTGVLTACASQDAVGKKVLAIYKIENGTLTIAGNSPGDGEFPAAFNAPDVREFVLKRQAQ